MPVILDFDQSRRKYPLNYSLEDAKLVLMLCADMLSDDMSAGAFCTKDHELFDEIQDQFASLSLGEIVSRSELSAIIEQVVEENSLYVFSGIVLEEALQCLPALRPATKQALLDVFGKKGQQIPEIKELDEMAFNSNPPAL